MADDTDDIDDLEDDDMEDNDDGDDWYDRVIKHVQITPPRCLSGFQATPEIEEEWNDCALWTIACTCGSSQGKLLGYPLYGEDEEFDEQLYLSPLSFQCAACHKVTPLIDTAVHGYNSEITEPGQVGDSNMRGEGDPIAAPCAACGEQEFTFQLCFMHAHFDLIEDEPELEPRAQDYFDAFNCNGTCAKCGKETTLSVFETA